MRLKTHPSHVWGLDLKTLNEIRNPSCTKCVLHESAKTICVMGRGSSSSKIMIIGEAPGANEDEQGKPFVGRAGQLLDMKLTEAGLDPNQCYITNLVKCRPPKNRPPEQDEIEACIDYLIAEYKSLRPTHVLLLGNTALKTLTNVEGGIMKNRGRIPHEKVVMENSLVYATLHPSAALRSKINQHTFATDLKVFATLTKRAYNTVSADEPKVLDTYKA